MERLTTVAPAALGMAPLSALPPVFVPVSVMVFAPVPVAVRAEVKTIGPEPFAVSVRPPVAAARFRTRSVVWPLPV